MQIYRRFFHYFKSLRVKLMVGIFALLVSTAANLAVPKILQFFIDQILIPDNPRGLVLLNLLVVGFVVLYVVKGIFYYGQEYLLAYVGQRVVVTLREELYRKMQYLSLGYHQRMQVGELLSRLTNDIQVVENSVVLAMPGLIAQPLTILGSIIFVVTTHWKLALFTMAIIPFVVLAINRFGERMRKTSGQIQSSVSDITTMIQETLSGIRVVKAFSQEEGEISRFRVALRENFHVSIKGVQIMATMTPVIEMLSSIGGVAFFWYGGREVIQGHLTTGELIGFITYMGIMVAPLKLVSRDLNLMQKAAGSLERIFEILDVEECITEKDDAITLPAVQGFVEFHNVSMRYEDEEKMVLQEISLQAKPGQVVALVGESGAGKSTLVNLIPRFYDPTSGKITVDGYQLRDVTIQSLRRQIAIVPQDTMLFKGTIAYNIAYGNPGATMDEIQEAARRANAHSFIMETSKGYETEVGERGQTLSGGQRQRIAIARAILADPRILILDEATSALDTASELLVQEALQEVMKNRTTFVIAHRLSTIINADLIVVMDRGQIVETGTHEELLTQEGAYYRLYRAQKERVIT